MPKGLKGFQKGHPQFNTGRTHFKKGQTPYSSPNWKVCWGKDAPNWKGGDITAECLYCGNDFTYARIGHRNRKFCSKSCGARAHHGKGWVTKTCPNCGASMTFKDTVKARRKFCSIRCANQFNRNKTSHRGPDHWNYKDGKGHEPYCIEFCRIREKIRARDNWHCRDCGIPQEEFENALDVHHIDGDKNNNDPDNLITLCRKCHVIAEKETRRIYGRKRNN